MLADQREGAAAAAGGAPRESARLLAIRDVAAPDIPAVRDVLVATWHATYDARLGRDKVAEVVAAWHSVPRLTAQIGQPETAFLLAERCGRVVGTAHADRREDGSVRLGRLYVLPGEQGTGIGRRLLDAALARFPDAARIWLEVEPGNAPAIAFYERQGFRREAAQASCGGRSDLTSIVMARSGAGPREPVVRPARDDDAQDLFGLITLCFAEYPGCYTDPHGDLPDLRAPGSTAAAKGGAFWVVEDARGRVCACVAVDFPEPGTAELHRLYVRPDQRRRGLGERLVALVEDHARGQGARRIVFWSDTRFTGAHRLYGRLGYRQLAGTRDLGDISNSVEYRFEKEL
jgi:ribosomal protein S18 acetylase RimI-like enzyme